MDSRKPEHLKKPQSSEFNNLLLKNKDGHEISLTSSQLVKWVQEQAQGSAKSKTGIVQSSSSLGRFGLKNAEDVIHFLNSPAGQSTKTEIAAELALIAEIKEERQFELMEKQRLQRRIMAFLFLSMLAKREANAKGMNDQLTQRLKKILSKKPSTKTLSGPQKSPYQQALNDILETYDDQINYLQKEHQSFEQEEQLLKDELSKHEDQLSDFSEKEAIYTDALDKFDDIEKDSGDSVENLETHLASLQEKINEKAESMNEPILEDNGKETQKGFYELHALRFEAAFVGDLIAVQKGEKSLCDADGNNIDSCSKAHFIIPTHQKIVKHDEQYYLLRADQDIHTLSQEEKADAAKQYESSRPEILSVKRQVVDNMEREKMHLDTKGDVLKELLSEVQAQRTLISNQLSQVQATRATVNNSLNNPNLLMQNSPIPVPTPTAKPAARKEQQASQSFKNIIQFFKRMNDFEPQLTAQQFMRLTKDHPKAQNAVSKEFENNSMSAPMTPGKIIHLLRVLERFGIDATKPGVTNILNPLELQDQAAERPAAQTTKPSIK